MELDIVFNIDYSNETGVKPLFADIPPYIEYLEVNCFEQFKRLIRRLEDEVVCYIWVHPSFSATMVQNGSSSDVTAESLPKLQELNIEVTQITRSTGKSSAQSGDYYPVGRMLDLKKNKKSYTVAELRKLLFPMKIVEPAMQKNQLRIKESIRADIVNINQRLRLLQDFLKNAYSDSQKYWFNGLFELPPTAMNAIFNIPYWHFDASNFMRYLNIDSVEQSLLEKDQLEVSEIVMYNEESRRWMIDESFYNEVSHRFETQAGDYHKKLEIATTLYLIHEAVHKVHNLDCNTVNGIGNFPRIIEEADYQADSIAVLTELAFYISQMGGIEKVSTDQILKKLCDTIEIAIETTFSFNPIQEVLRLIQVRRVNRYLIWFYQFFKAKSLVGTFNSSEELMNELLKNFANKPLIEITGPIIKSNTERDRTFYDFDYIKHQEEVGILKFNNSIVRLGKIQGVEFKDFYDGIRESNFNKMYKFLTVIFAANKAALN